MDEDPYTAPQSERDPPAETRSLFAAPILTAFLLFIVLPLVVLLVLFLEWWF
jgi:hypothetical protein